MDITYEASDKGIHLFTIKGYQDDDGDNQVSAKVQVSERPTDILPAGTDVKAEVSLHYTLRHIDNGGDTYEERDDDITEITGDKPTGEPVTIIPHRESAPQYYGLHESGQHNRWLKASINGATSIRMCFDSYEDARALLDYLKTRKTPSSLGKAQLGFQDAEDLVTADDLAYIQAKAGCDAN